MSAHENINQYIEKRLQEWADWFMRGNQQGVGYPHESFIALFEKGVVIRKKKSFRLPILPTHEPAEEMEKFIVEMSQQNRQMAGALRKHYLGREPTIPLKAKAFGVSLAHFNVLLGMARQWLAGRLSTPKST